MVIGYINGYDHEFTYRYTVEIPGYEEEKKPGIFERMKPIATGFEYGIRFLPSIIKIVMYGMMLFMMINVMGAVWSGVQVAIPIIQIIVPFMVLVMIAVLFTSFIRLMLRVVV